MLFDMAYEDDGMEHQLTKPNRPWGNGQIQHVNRTIKDAAVKRNAPSHPFKRCIAANKRQDKCHT
jgi:hypothetical protein